MIDTHFPKPEVESLYKVVPLAHDKTHTQTEKYSTCKADDFFVFGLF